MDEQQMNEGLLCDADRQLIASAARFHSVCVEVETLEPVWAGSRLHESC